MNDIGVYAFSISSPLSVSQRIEAAVRDFRPAFPPAGLSLRRSEKGKPFFQDSALQLSISHSGLWWVLALSEELVGVDVQETRPARFEKLARRFFHPEETAALEKAGFENFYSVWTAKESYVKLTGRGIDAHFREFSVYSLPVYFASPVFQPGYVLTVCSNNPSNPILKYL